MTLDIKDRLYTSSEVAEILGVSLRSVYRYLEEGKLDADIKTATGRHRFSKKNILDFLHPSESQSKPSFESKSNEFKGDIPATIKANSFSPVDTVEEDFDFDNFFETDLVKKIDDNTNFSSNKDLEMDNNNSAFPGLNKDEEDDLEKLFEELEKEFTKQNESSLGISNEAPKPVSKITEDDFDFDFDFLDSNESVSDYLKIKEEEFTPRQDISSPKNSTSVNNNSDDFDFDFLNNFFEEDKSDIKTSNTDRNELEKSFENVPNNKEDDKDIDFFDFDSIFGDSEEEKESKEVKGNKNEFENEHKIKEKININDESESWLEKFRKASEKVSEPKKQKEEIEDEEFDLTSFFKNDNSTSSISSKTSPKIVEEKNFRDEFKTTNTSKKKEYYYISSLSGPKEIAQTIDKISRKFDLDYAFTLNAGLSLHKDISPFTLIHVYINERDLEIFEDYLKLTPSSERDAHLCIKIAEDREIFEDSYELNGLFVVSNVQLRSDFIDKGMDNYAREV